MSTTIREALAGSRWSRGQDFMGKRLALLAIRLLVSVNLLYAAIFVNAGSDPYELAKILGDLNIKMTDAMKTLRGSTSPPWCGRFGNYLDQCARQMCPAVQRATLRS